MFQLRKLKLLTLLFLLVSLIVGSNPHVLEKTMAIPQFHVKDLIQVTDGTTFNRPGSLVKTANGSYHLYSSCYVPIEEKHYLEVSYSSNGSLWSNPQRLPFPPSCVYPSAIQDRDGMFWLTWEQQNCSFSSCSFSLLVANSSNGVDWSTPLAVSYGKNSRPSLIQDENGMYWIAYEDNTFGAEDVIVRNSTDGVTWSAPIFVTEQSDDYCDIMASLYQDLNGTYWIVMTRAPPVWDGGWGIWSSHSSDGINWTPVTELPTGVDSRFPHLAQDSSGLYVLVWKEFCYSASGGDNIWIRTSDDCINWNPKQQLTDDEENSLLTCLLIDGEEYFVVYDVWRGNEETIWLMILEEPPTPPVARFTYSPELTILEDEITFDASSSFDVDGEIISYEWDFGDGSTAEGSIVTHVYFSAGNYSVTLTVMDDEGRVSTSTQVLELDIESAFRGALVIFVQGSRTIVGKGSTVDLSIVIENMGKITEVYDLFVYANTTIVTTYENITHPAENLTITTSTLDTADLSKGNYNISAQITSQTETTIIDMTNLDICVTIPGDVDANFHVDIYDIVAIASIYGVNSGSPQFNANCDLDGDGDIDIFDIVATASHYGESW